MASRGQRLERDFQAHVIERLNDLISPDGYVFPMDGNYRQGFPDILFLYKNTWGALECKRSSCEPNQPNQEYYVDHLNELSFAAFIYPGNEDEVFDDLQQTLRIQ
jgi:hypothetical protein